MDEGCALEVKHRGCDAEHLVERSIRLRHCGLVHFVVLQRFPPTADHWRLEAGQALTAENLHSGEEAVRIALCDKGFRRSVLGPSGPR